MKWCAQGKSVRGKKAAVEKRRINELGEQLQQFLCGGQLAFVIAQIRCASRSARGRRWSDSDKSLAL